jgi:hypothetical protein
MTRSRSAVALSLVLLSVGSVQSRARAVVLDFETPGQYEANFREVLAGDDLGVTSQGGNNVLRKGGGASSPSVAIYDTTPASTAVKTTFPQGGFRASFDARFGDAGSSVGVYVVDSQDESRGFLSALIINDSSEGGLDVTRTSRQSNPLTGELGSGGGGAGRITNADPGSTLYTPVSVTYWTDEAGSPQLVTTWGSHGTATTSRGVQTSTFVGTTPINNPQFALRFFDAVPGNAGGIEIDNLEIVPVPEPAALGVLFAAAAGLMLRRTRYRGDRH